MTEAVFIQRNNALWKKLEAYLNYPVPSFEAIEAQTNLYRIVSGHLSYARAYYPGSSLCEYLEQLTARAHTVVYAYTAQKRRMQFFTCMLPTALRKKAVFLWIAAAMFLLSAVVSFTTCLTHPEYTDAFLPSTYKGIDAADLNMDQEALSSNGWSSAIVSNSIMVNNIYVSVLAFGLGITFGVGTVYILLFNGAMLGALASIYALQGNSLFFWSIILPHGVLELTAIFIAGGAGLCIGHALIRPGPCRRADALLTAARDSLALVGLAAILLCVAAVIEGFFTPAAVAPLLKLLFAAATAAPLTLYFFYVGKRAT